MKVGILAAGKGERLRAQRVLLPKPLVSVGGRPLIARLLHMARQCGVEEAVCIVNAAFPEVAQYCQERDWGLSVQCLSRSTAHSLESFLALQPYLEAEPFLSGYALYGHRIAKVIDVDRPADIVTAEALLAEFGEG